LTVFDLLIAINLLDLSVLHGSIHRASRSPSLREGERGSWAANG